MLLKRISHFWKRSKLVLVCPTQSARTGCDEDCTPFYMHSISRDLFETSASHTWLQRGRQHGSIASLTILKKSFMQYKDTLFSLRQCYTTNLLPLLLMLIYFLWYSYRHGECKLKRDIYYCFMSVARYEAISTNNATLKESSVLPEWTNTQEVNHNDNATHFCERRKQHIDTANPDPWIHTVQGTTQEYDDAKIMLLLLRSRNVPRLFRVVMQAARVHKNQMPVNSCKTNRMSQKLIAMPAVKPDIIWAVTWSTLINKAEQLFSVVRLLRKLLFST